MNDIHAFASQYASAQGLLLDSHAPGEAGGTGKTFDWHHVPADLAQAIILAGGLHAGNVRQALSIVKPYAVDISSSVESEPGIKDAEKIRLFMRQITQSDSGTI